MEQDTHSTYDSIIPEYGPQWTRILDSEPFARLHAKFWDASMQDEERKWRETQSKDVPMNVEVPTAEVDEEDDLDSPRIHPSLRFLREISEFLWYQFVAGDSLSCRHRTTRHW
jgi:hypothetical protein